MNKISDSDAELTESRQFAQHQAAITLLQREIDNPDIVDYKWLDLACGKGQIILHLKDNLADDLRKKINFYGFDIDQKFIQIAEKTASTLSLKSNKFEIGELSKFNDIIEASADFDFVTLTNTIHEINPANFLGIIIKCLLRLSANGCLFIYDMETLPNPELGAIPWTKEEIEEIFTSIFKVIGTGYNPKPGRWKHSTCYGWNIQIHRNRISLNTDKLKEKEDDILNEAKIVMNKIIARKFQNCNDSLISYSKFKPETDEENKEKLNLLYDYWSLSRAMEVIK